MQHYINSFSLFHFLSSQQKFFSMKYFVYGGMCYLDRKRFLQTQTKGKFGDISINNKCNITTTTIREMVLFAENCTFMCQVLCKMTCGFVQFRFKNVLSQFVTIFQLFFKYFDCARCVFVVATSIMSIIMIMTVGHNVTLFNSLSRCSTSIAHERRNGST